MTGSILIHSKIVTPPGYLPCDGAAVSRTTYSDLFGVIGTTYGSGDGSTTFNVPNLKGKTIVGKSADTEFDVLGETGGAKTINIAHTHTPNTHSHTFSSGSTSAGESFTGDGNQSETLSAPGGHTHTMSAATIGNQSVASMNSQLSSAQSILSKYITLYFLIKT